MARGHSLRCDKAAKDAKERGAAREGGRESRGGGCGRRGRKIQPLVQQTIVWRCCRLRRTPRVCPGSTSRCEENVSPPCTSASRGGPCGLCGVCDDMSGDALSVPTKRKLPSESSLDDSGGDSLGLGPYGGQGGGSSERGVGSLGGMLPPTSRPRLTRCNQCAGCKAPNCGNCVNCFNMIQFGGPGTKRQVQPRQPSLARSVHPASPWHLCSRPCLPSRVVDSPPPTAPHLGRAARRVGVRSSTGS